jgi:hypothetical protein
MPGAARGGNIQFAVAAPSRVTATSVTRVATTASRRGGGAGCYSSAATMLGMRPTRAGSGSHPIGHAARATTTPAKARFQENGGHHWARLQRVPQTAPCRVDPAVLLIGHTSGRVVVAVGEGGLPRQRHRTRPPPPGAPPGTPARLMPVRP